MARCSCVLTGTGVTGTLTLSQPSEAQHHSRVEIKSRAPHAIDATCFRSCICAMAWRFHAIDATLSPYLRQLDGVEAT